MKLQQLRYLCELVDRGFNVSRTAVALNTSQPGVSRQLQQLESELGNILLERRNTRILGLTETGRLLLPTMRRMLAEADNLRRQAREVAASGKVRFIIGTSHTFARHTLLAVLKSFIHRHRKIAIQLRESAAPRIMQLLAAGEIDIGVATEPVERPPGINLMPCYKVAHSLITPPGHPLLKHRRVTLQQLMQFPLITYDERHYLGKAVRERFKREGLDPDFVISIIDDDVMKAYVEAGFGVAILPSIAFSRKRDRRLRAIPVDHLFEAGTCVVMTRDGIPMQTHVRDFIELVKATPVSGMAAAHK